MGSYEVEKVKILSHHKIDNNSSEENISNMVLINENVLNELKEIYKREREERDIEVITTPFDIAAENLNSKIINAFTGYISNGLQLRYKLP